MAKLTLEGTLSASDAVTDQFLSQIYPSIANEINPVIYVLAILYWAVYGYKIYAGHAPLNWQDVLTKVLMTTFVFTALEWSGVAGMIYHAFADFMEGTAATIMAGESSTSMLGALYNNVGIIASSLQSVNPYQLGVLLLGFGMFLLNCLLLAVAICYLTVAKLGLALTMVLLPIFLGFLLFPATRQWFMNWLSSMLNFAFIYILVITIVRIGFVIFGASVEEAAQTASGANAALMTVPQVAQLYIFEGVLIYFMLQVRSWAAGLSGGTLHSGGNAMRMAGRFISSGQK